MIIFIGHLFPNEWAVIREQKILGSVKSRDEAELIQYSAGRFASKFHVGHEREFDEDDVECVLQGHYFFCAASIIKGAQ